VQNTHREQARRREHSATGHWGQGRSRLRKGKEACSAMQENERRCARGGQGESRVWERVGVHRDGLKRVPSNEASVRRTRKNLRTLYKSFVRMGATITRKGKRTQRECNKRDEEVQKSNEGRILKNIQKTHEEEKQAQSVQHLGGLKGKRGQKHFAPFRKATLPQLTELVQKKGETGPGETNLATEYSWKRNLRLRRRRMERSQMRGGSDILKKARGSHEGEKVEGCPYQRRINSAGWGREKKKTQKSRGKKRTKLKTKKCLKNKNEIAIGEKYQSHHRVPSFWHQPKEEKVLHLAVEQSRVRVSGVICRAYRNHAVKCWIANLL